MKTARFYPAGSVDDADAVVLHDVSKLPMRVLRSTFGLEMPAYAVRTVQSIGVDGARFDSVVASRPSIKVPVFLQATDHRDLRYLKSQLAVAMNPQRGAGTLEITDAIGVDYGEIRRTSAVYVGGLEGDGANVGGAYWFFTLEFRGLDPYWYSPEPARGTWSGKPSGPFFPWSFPWSLAPYGVDPVLPFQLDGDAQSWGTFTLSGPWSRVKFTNVDTGKWWQVSRELNSGETVVVKTKPGQVSVRTADGVNAYGLLSPKSQLFPIDPRQTVIADADGADDTTVLDLEVPVAWLTAP